MIKLFIKYIRMNLFKRPRSRTRLFLVRERIGLIA